jgi:hypothetical protein
MWVIIVAIISYGFGQTVDSNLLHAKPPRPFVLYIHAITFTSWILLYGIQSTMVRARAVRAHRVLGWFGAVLGVGVFVLGMWTTVVMCRFHGPQAFAPVMFLSFADTTAFAVLFALGIWFRKRPEYHRRLLFVATCVLTSAGFGRFPVQWFADHWFYVGVDCLLMTGVLHDLLALGRVHKVYRVALPSLIVLQLFAAYVAFTPDPTWIRIANRIVS